MAARAPKLSFAVLLVSLAVPAAAQQTGSITGTIVDARDGTPLEKVSVRVQDTKLGPHHQRWAIPAR
jgi:hypothetical protein